MQRQRWEHRCRAQRLDVIVMICVSPGNMDLFSQQMWYFNVVWCGILYDIPDTFGQSMTCSLASTLVAVQLRVLAWHEQVHHAPYTNGSSRSTNFTSDTSETSVKPRSKFKDKKTVPIWDAPFGAMIQLWTPRGRHEHEWVLYTVDVSFSVGRCWNLMKTKWSRDDEHLELWVRFR